MRSLGMAVELAAGDFGWSIVSKEPGRFVAETFVRNRHRAKVEIGFDPSRFWINYLDSDKLDYSPNDRRSSTGPRGRRVTLVKGPRIHRNYNIWVEKLATRLQLRLSNPPNLGLPSASSDLSPRLIADELEKLDALRERGVLTREEFETQKQRLLSGD